MGRPPLSEARETRRDIVRAAQDLVQTRGFNGFSYLDIAERLGIRKATIHYYFPSKDDLALALMDDYLARFERWTEKVADEEPGPARLKRYFDFFLVLAGDGSRICPCGALASDWNTLSPPVQAAVQRLIDAHRTWLAANLGRGRRAAEQAQFVFASIQGAMQTARAQSNVGVFRSALRQIASAVGVT
jgi:TetR/AcrR family transcriptional regulator, transcriptional repressor for nem operon